MTSSMQPAFEPTPHHRRRNYISSPFCVPSGISLLKHDGHLWSGNSICCLPASGFENSFPLGPPQACENWGPVATERRMQCT